MRNVGERAELGVKKRGKAKHLHGEVVQTTRQQTRNHRALFQQLQLRCGEVQTHFGRPQRVHHSQKSSRFLEIHKRVRFFEGVEIAFSVTGGSEEFFLSQRAELFLRGFDAVLNGFSQRIALQLADAFAHVAFAGALSEAREGGAKNGAVRERSGHVDVVDRGRNLRRRETTRKRRG